MKRMRALTCTNEALSNELYFGIQGLKWGAGEMDPDVIWCYILKNFPHISNITYKGCAVDLRSDTLEVLPPYPFGKRGRRFKYRNNFDSY